MIARRAAADEVVAVSTGGVERIGWFAESPAGFGSAVAGCAAVSVALPARRPVLGATVAKRRHGHPEVRQGPGPAAAGRRAERGRPVSR